MSDSSTNIIVIGAGYAGLLSAARIARKTHGAASVTLISSNDTFTERLRLHQFATGQAIPWRPIAETLRGSRVRFVRATVTGITPDSQTLTIAANGQIETLRYDYLVYALGSDIDRQGVPGIAEHAYTLTPRGPRSAETLRETLPELAARGARVTVCGAGPTGIETAAEFASAYPGLRVTLVSQGALGMFRGAAVARYMRRSLERLHVTILDQTTVTEVRADGVRTADGQLIAHDLCLWAGGFAVQPLAREAGILVNQRDQIIVDPYLRSVSHPSIFAIGDAAWPRETPGAPVRMSAVTAAIMGAHGADSISAVVRGKAPKPFSFAYLGQGIALGHGNAIGFNNYPNDKPVPPYFTGWLGYWTRNLFVVYLASAARYERHWLGSFIWPGRGRYAASQRRQAATGAREAVTARRA